MSEHDLLNHRVPRILLYGIPILAIVATGFLKTPARLTGVIWFLSLTVMGGACLWNALHCGRVHCYFTGPFFLAVGLAALLDGFGLLPLGANGWGWLGALLLLGGVGLHRLPEKLWGKYRRK